MLRNSNIFTQIRNIVSNMKYFTFRPHDKMWKKIQYNLGLLRQNFTDTGYHVINWIHLEAIKLNWNSSMHYCPSGGCVNWPSLDVARLGVCTSHGQETAWGVQGVARCPPVLTSVSPGTAAACSWGLPVAGGELGPCSALLQLPGYLGRRRMWTPAGW